MQCLFQPRTLESRQSPHRRCQAEAIKAEMVPKGTGSGSDQPDPTHRTDGDDSLGYLNRGLPVVECDGDNSGVRTDHCQVSLVAERRRAERASQRETGNLQPIAEFVGTGASTGTSDGNRMHGEPCLDSLHRALVL